MATEADLALSILKKVVEKSKYDYIELQSERELTIDVGWVQLTEEETALIEALLVARG